jgi:hypothetical protein
MVKFLLAMIWFAFLGLLSWGAYGLFTMGGGYIALGAGLSLAILFMARNVIINSS